MAITTTIAFRTVMGNKRVVAGKSVLSAGSTGGDVVTGMSRVESFIVTPEGGTQLGHSVDETLPLSGGNVTVEMETSNTTFYWEAKGL